MWLLAIAGAWLSRREWRALSLLYFVQISQTLMYLLFHPSTRYRSPDRSAALRVFGLCGCFAWRSGGGGAKPAGRSESRCPACARNSSVVQVVRAEPISKPKPTRSLRNGEFVPL